MKKISWGYLLLALLLGMTGALLLFYPAESMSTLGYIIGGSAVALGVLQAIRTLSQKKRGGKFTFSMLVSVLTVIGGAALLFLPEKLFPIFTALIGLFIIIDASFKLQTVIRAHRYDLKAWWVMAVFTCATIAGGFFCVYIHSDKLSLLTVLLGISLFLDGFQNLLTLFCIDRLNRRETEALSATAEAEAVPEPVPEPVPMSRRERKKIEKLKRQGKLPAEPEVTPEPEPVPMSRRERKQAEKQRRREEKQK